MAVGRTTKPLGTIDTFRALAAIVRGVNSALITRRQGRKRNADIRIKTKRGKAPVGQREGDVLSKKAGILRRQARRKRKPRTT